MGSGKLIVIEGTDGSGKGTQSKRLLQKLEQVGFETAYADFPQYGLKSAGLVENYLTGKYGSAEAVDPKVASVFYAVDRYDASFGIRKNLEAGRIVICNRYISANMGHQGGKIHDPAKREEYLAWLEDLEYNFFKIPKPDLTILLLVPYETAQKLLTHKGHREYIGGLKKDIHEANAAHLKDTATAFAMIAKEKGWTVIDCTKDGKLMSIEEIHEAVWNAVSPVVASVAIHKQARFE